MTPRTRWLILGFALLGLVFAGAAAYVHYRLLTEPNYVSPCDINARFNCSEVYLSSYGSVRGISVALTGVFFFGMVALIGALSETRAKPSPVVAPAYLFALATIGLAVVLYLGWASVVVLKTYCILCLGTYVAVIGLFIVSGTDELRANDPVARPAVCRRSGSGAHPTAFVRVSGVRCAHRCTHRLVSERSVGERLRKHLASFRVEE